MAKQRNWIFHLTGRLFRRALILTVLLLDVGCSSETPSHPSKSPVAAMSALEQMSIAFEGNPSPSTIKPKLDRALKMYGLEATEDNYSRAGSVLVAMCEKNDVSEMTILETMLVSPMPGMKFHEAAAWVAVELGLKKEK